MKYSLYLLLLFILPFSSLGQQKEIIKQQALQVAKATQSSDFGTVIKYTHPSLIHMMGGPEAMLKMIESSMGKMSSQGISIDSVAIGEPEAIFKAGKELHCLVPEALLMTVPNGKLVAKSYLIAVSGDNGLNWTFINVSSQINNETISQILPNFNQDLRIPEDSKPIFYKNK